MPTETLHPQVYETPAQLQARTGVHAKTWEAWRRQGKGPRFIRVSARKVLYNVAEVDAWLKGREVQSTPQAVSKVN